MNTQIGFIGKILLISTILSFLIKYGGRYLPIQATNINAAIAVLLPPIVIGLILGWQYLKSIK